MTVVQDTHGKKKVEVPPHLAKAQPMDPRYWYIDGVAYDFSKFVAKHPGGEYSIELGRGTECQGMIYSYHLDIPKVRSYFEAYRVEKVPPVAFPPNEKFSFADDGFFATVKAEVNKHFKETGQSTKAGPLHLFICAMNLLLLEVMMYYMCAHASWLAAFVHGILRAVLVVQTTHGASHFAFSHNPMVNRWMYRIGTSLIGLWSPKIWDLQHVVAHHVYSNEWPYDTDSAFPLKSILYNQRRLWFHKYQHIYMWVVYALTIPAVILNSTKDLFVGKQVLFKIRYHKKEALIEAWTCAILGWIYLALPYFFLSFWTAFSITLFSNSVSSLYFSLQFVVNHEVDAIVDEHAPPANIDWGEHQVNNSLSFAATSRIALEAAGGLNTQVEHHLFPGVHYRHYIDIHHIIKRVAKDFGIKYHEEPHVIGALKGHYRLLKNPPQSIRDNKKTQ